MDSVLKTLGAGSGIDTATLIDQLVTAETTARKSPLTTRQTALTAQISGLGQIKSSLQGIASSLQARIDSGAVGRLPASSDSSAVAIASSGGGPAADFRSSITVGRLAASQTLVAPALASAAAVVGIGTLTIGFGQRTANADGSFSFTAGTAAPIDITITAANNSLTGLRDAINKAGGGVTASIITSNGSARLSLTGSDGADAAFVISAATDGSDTGLARFAYTPGNAAMTLTSAAADAALTIDGIDVTRPTNVIGDLIDGATLTLARPTTAAVTLSASRDLAAMSSTVSDIAASLTAMRGVIKDMRQGASGTTAAGALVNDPTARRIDQQLVNLVTAAIPAANGLRLRDLGISVARSGDIQFDSAAFAKLPANRQADAEALLKALAAPTSAGSPWSLQAIGDEVTSVTDTLNTRQTAITTDLANIDTRLASYRDQLTRQYAAMEQLVAASKAVGTQLDQQIAAWNNQKQY